MIRVRFPNPGDSPTRSSPLRVRYAFTKAADGRAVPVLNYGHGTGRLSAEDWNAWRMAGATIEASSDREAGIVREALGDAMLPVQKLEPSP